jgi:hypothetical protein
MSAALAPYGASLDADNAIVSPTGRRTGVKLAVIRGRLVATSERGVRLFSGPPTAKAIGRFVESFWFWTPRI